MNNNWKLELHKLSLWNKVTRSDIGELSDFIEQELKKEREEIIEWIEKQDWECFEQTFITKDIINTIKNRYEQSTNRTK